MDKTRLVNRSPRPKYPVGNGHQCQLQVKAPPHHLETEHRRNREKTSNRTPKQTPFYNSIQNYTSLFYREEVASLVNDLTNDTDKTIEMIIDMRNEGTLLPLIICGLEAERESSSKLPRQLP